MAAAAPAGNAPAEAAAPAANPHAIKEGDSVILDVNGERQSVILKLQEGGTFKVERGVVSTDALIGAKFGSLFGVDMETQSLQPQQRVCETAGEDWERVLEIDRNNAALNDAGTANQALTAADIARLKQEGKSGDEIVAALTAGSATFQGKTQYSQEKYRRKKAKKYVTRITAVRPTARSIAEFYFAKTPLKIGCLRADSLAILMNLANISPGSRCLLVDGVSGLVTGAAMERVGWHGRCVRSWPGQKAAPSDIINLFNFSIEQRRACLSAPLASLRDMLQDKAAPAAAAGADAGQAQPAATANGAQPEQPQAAAAPQAEVVGGSASMDASGPGAAPAAEPSTAAAPEASAAPAEAAPAAAAAATAQQQGQAASKQHSRVATPEDAAFEAERQRQYEQRQAELQRMCRAGFQGCVIAVPGFEPNALVSAVWPLLAPSASFAVFFGSLQPLAECMAGLQRDKAAVALALQEPWWREYQVLPGRTHPTMSTSGTGGYILSGTKLAPPSA